MDKDISKIAGEQLREVVRVGFVKVSGAAQEEAAKRVVLTLPNNIKYDGKQLTYKR